MRFHLSLITGLIFSLLGCTAPNQNLRPANNHKDIFRQQMVKASAHKTATSEALPEMTSEEHERLGDFHFSQGNLQNAFVHYEKSLQLNPDNPGVHYKKGILFTVSRSNKDAIKEFQKVLEKDPKYALAHEGLGQALFQMARYEDAEKHFQEALVLNPKLWKAHNLLGVIYDYKKRHETAAQEYRAAIALKPDNGSLYNNLGVSYSLQGDYEAAIEVFKEALKNATSSGKIYNNLGLVLAKQRRYYEALEVFRKAGDEAQAQNNLGVVYLQQGEREKAIRSFEKAMESRPTFYARASDNLKKARTAHLYASSFDSNMPTLSNAQVERRVANLEKKLEKQEKAGARASKEPVLQASVSSDQVVPEKKLDSLPENRSNMPTPSNAQVERPVANLEKKPEKQEQAGAKASKEDVLQASVSSDQVVQEKKLDSLPEGRSNMPTPSNARAERPVANLEKKPEQQEKAGAKASKEHVLQASVSSDQVVQEKKLDSLPEGRMSAGGQGGKSLTLGELHQQLRALQSRYSDRHPDVIRVQTKIAKLTGGLQESIDAEGSKGASSKKVSVSQATYAQVENPRLEGLDEGVGFHLKFMLVNTSPDEPIAGTVAIIAALKPPHKPQFISFPSMELDDSGLPMKLEKSLEFTRISRFKYFSGEFDFPLSYAESFRILVYNPGDQLVYDYALLPEPVANLEKKPEQQEKVGAKASKEHVLQASVSSDQVVQEKKLDSLPEGRSNMPTPSNAQAERPVANLEKKPEQQEKAGTKASKEDVLQASVSSDQVVQEKKLGSLPEGRSNMPTPSNAQVERPVANLEKKPEQQEKAGARASKEPVLQASISSDQIIPEKKLAGGLQKSINAEGSNSHFTYAQVENPRLEGLDEGVGFRLKFMLVNTSPDEPIAGTVAIIAALKPPHKPQFISFPSMELDDSGLPMKLEKSLEFTRISRFKYFSGEFDFPLSYAESFRILVYNPGDQLVYDYALLPEEVVSLSKLSR